MTGVFPGSFDPLTVAHLAIVDAAVARFGLEQIDLVLSRVALAKEDGGHQPIEERRRAIEEVAAATGRTVVRVRVTDDRLIADIARGYDVCVIGADKWQQLHDLAFYASADERDAALARLPLLAVAPRAGTVLPPAGTPGVVVLDVDPAHRHVSSTAVRDGRDDWRATT